ncbi:MAG: leucyl/phenylalanyl-tRNA--protein transferase [Bacteroidales bacterium]|nr:leucyl/phenylalanyl-tRNA--protein transferase [Bacteroidales bacterium]
MTDLCQLDFLPPHLFVDIEALPEEYFENWGDIVAFGGGLSVDRLLAAYTAGAYPMPYGENNGVESIIWCSPFPRLLVLPQNAKFSKSLLRRIRHQDFEVKVDTDFAQVIKNCQAMNREGGWINEKIIHAYQQLHDKGFAHSVETYKNGKLVGGLYGVSIGKMFAGESMFHYENDASKVAFYYLVQILLKFDFHFIDCQQVSPHFIEWGGTTFSKQAFFEKLNFALSFDSLQQKWTSLL